MEKWSNIKKYKFEPNQHIFEVKTHCIAFIKLNKKMNQFNNVFILSNIHTQINKNEQILITVWQT